MDKLDRYRGALIGEAAGDALGYTVEFLHEPQIFQRFGPAGITDYVLDEQGVARFSDDTQMTLYTAEGLLFAHTRGALRGIMASISYYMSFMYQDWYRTQTEDFSERTRCAWVSGFPELFARRAPGTTCMTACAAGANGTLESPINDSKGCGGIMRVAPVGLFYSKSFSNMTRHMTYADIQLQGAEIAALTHGHELGWLPAGAFAQIVSMIVHEDSPLTEAVAAASATLPEAFPEARMVGALQEIMERAVSLASSNLSDLEAIHELGEGWVAEETLAIALLCALRHQGDFAGAIAAASNHNGDSDSTAAVAGTIIGAQIGYEAIPHRFIEPLELHEAIVEIADDLSTGCGHLSEFVPLDRAWAHKYIHHDYVQWRREGSKY